MEAKSKENLVQTKPNLMLSALLIMLLVGSVYISQLIFQEISQSYHIDILAARNVFSLSCFFMPFLFLFMARFRTKFRQSC